MSKKNTRFSFSFRNSLLDTKLTARGEELKNTGESVLQQLTAKISRITKNIEIILNIGDVQLSAKSEELLLEFMEYYDKSNINERLGF